MVDAWLCLATRKKIFGINLSNLATTHVNWKLLPTLNFDFSSDLPTSELCPFVFDSNIYMASSYLQPEWDRYIDGDPNFPLNPVYEFRVDWNDKTNPHPQFSLLESFPPAPRPFIESYITNISGDVYLYVDPSQELDIPESIYVLRSGSKEWRPLPLPPPPPVLPPDAIWGILGIRASGMFVAHGKLFLASTKSDFPYLVSFNPGEQSWTVEHSGKNVEKNASSLSLRECPDSGLFGISIPYFSVILQYPTQDSSLGKYHVAFSSSSHDPFMGPWDGLKFAFIKLTASLLNENGGVILYQHLDQCFEGIQPHLHIYKINLVDLGQGKLCAVLFGYPLENDYSPVLCISIFTPLLTKDFAALHTDSTLMEEQTFLSVTVHSKSLYTLKDWYGGDMLQHAFIWPPPEQGNFHSRTTVL